MKKIIFFLLSMFLLISAWYGISKFIEPHDYSRDSRHFFCLKNGHCITMWRTRSGICYVIPGKYSDLSRPTSQSYITSTFKKGMDIIWQKNTNDIIVYLEDENKQIIHQSPRGIKIIDYNLNKKYNDSLFFYFDGNYERYKKNVDYMRIDILEELAYGKDGKILR